MFPVLLRIGAFEITSFGVMVALGALAGFWVFGRELEARGLGHASHLAVSTFVAGLVGAKLLWVAEHFGEEPTLDLLTSRGGLSWFGGLVAGVSAGLLIVLHRRWPLLPLLALVFSRLARRRAASRELRRLARGIRTAVPAGLAATSAFRR